MLSRISLRLSDILPRVERNGVAAEDLESGRGTNGGPPRAPARRCSSHLGAPIGAGGQVLTALLIATP